MKIIYSSLRICLWCSLILCAVVPVVAQSFNKAYGTTDDENAASIAKTIDGNYVVTGRRANSSGPLDIIAMKVSTSGTILWTGLYTLATAPAESKGYCIDQAVDQNGQDNGYIATGYYKGVYRRESRDIVRKKLLFLKLDQNGGIQWVRALGSDAATPQVGDDVEGRSVLQTPDLGFVAVGTKANVIDSQKCIVLAKVDASGSQVWFYTYCTTASVNMEGMCVKQTDDNGNGVLDNADGFIITGVFNDNRVFVMKVQSDGTFSWMKTYNNKFSVEGGNHIEPSALGRNGYIIAGSHYSNENPDRSWDAFLLRITSTGAFSWARSIGDIVATPPPNTPVDDEGHSVKEDGNGDFVLTGGSHAYGLQHQGVLYKVSSTGTTVLASQHYGGSGDDHFEDIVVCNDGSYAMAGHSDSFSGTNDIYIAKTKMNGLGCRAQDCEPHNFAVEMNVQNKSVVVTDIDFLYEPVLVRGTPEYGPYVECEGLSKMGWGFVDTPGTTKVAANVQVYPNPVTADEYTITFAVEKAGWTEITLYNALGDVVARPVAANMSEGSYSLQLSGSVLPSGTYICKLTTGDTQFTTTIIITR